MHFSLSSRASGSEQVQASPSLAQVSADTYPGRYAELIDGSSQTGCGPVGGIKMRLSLVSLRSLIHQNPCGPWWRTVCSDLAQKSQEERPPSLTAFMMHLALGRGRAALPLRAISTLLDDFHALFNLTLTARTSTITGSLDLHKANTGLGGTQLRFPRRGSSRIQAA